MKAGLAFGSLAALLLLPAAAALYPFQGTLHSADPIEASGLVTVGPLGKHKDAFIRIDEGLPTANEVILQAEKVRLVLRRYEHSAPSLPSLPTPLPVAGSASYEVTQAELQLVAFEGAPQVFLETRSVGGQPSDDLKADGLRCGIQPADPDEVSRFPADGGRADPRSRTERRPDRGDLSAQCRTGAVWAERPLLAEVYGMDLRLRSVERNEIIRTGTFSEEVVPGTGGLPAPAGEEATLTPRLRTVTQILEILPPSGALNFSVPLPSTVRFHAAGLLVAGHVHVGNADGAIAWSGQIRRGNFEGLEATGVFAFESGADAHVQIDGLTLEAPPAAAPAQALAPAGAGPTLGLLGAAVAAGLGLAALLLRALWPQFSKLRADSILDHPRRRGIFELVRRDPGVGMSAVSRTLGIPWTATVRHIRTLERTGHLRVRRVGGRTALFLAAPGWIGKEEQVALLRREHLRRVHAVLLEKPGLDQRALGDRLGYGQPQVSKALARLQGAGLVRAHRVGRRLAYSAQPLSDPQGLPLHQPSPLRPAGLPWASAE